MVVTIHHMDLVIIIIIMEIIGQKNRKKMPVKELKILENIKEKITLEQHK
jgi:hypothetical protein